jgi:hypothetical protein
MSYLNDESLDRAFQFASLHGFTIEDRLGAGVHGSVFASNRQSAIKVHDMLAPYERERDVYLRLRVSDVVYVADCSVPKLIRFDDDLLIIEMTIVDPPFVLDFGGAYLDRPPEFPEETMAEWEADKQEQFGDDWPTVRGVLAGLERFGVFMVDVNPGNVRLRN